MLLLIAEIVSIGVLKTDTSVVCWKLFDRGIPFLFHTGRMYSAFRQWPSAPVVLKSASEGLIDVLAGLFR